MAKRKINLPLIVAVLAVLVMGIPLLAAPVLGYGDNGEFALPMQSISTYKLDRYEADQYNSYFANQYGEYLYYNETAASYPSSHYVFLLAAKALDSLFTPAGDGLFDIRFYAALLIVHAGVTLYLLADYMQYRFASWAERIAAGIACLFIFADAAYFLYFNSFYPDGLVYVSFLGALGCLLLLTQRRYSPVVLLSGFALNVLIVTGSKANNTPLGFVLGIVCIVLSFSHLWATKAEHPSYQRKTFVRGLLIAAGTTAIAASVAFQLVLPPSTDYVTKYHAMTRGVLMTSENPEQRLELQNIDGQFALLDGTSTYDRYPPVDLENVRLQSEFLDRYTLVSIASYYAENPGRLLSVINEGAQDMYRIRPGVVGNYRREAGQAPGAQSAFASLNSLMKQSVFPHTVGFLLLWALAAILLGIKDKPRTIILSGVVVIALLQFVMPIILGGNTLFARYMVVFNLAFDLVNYIGLATALAYGIRFVQGKLPKTAGKAAANGETAKNA